MDRAVASLRVLGTDEWHPASPSCWDVRGGTDSSMKAGCSLAVMSDIPWAAIVPLIVAAAAFVVYCWVDIRRNEVRYLPKWAWVVICVISIPVGGVVYLLVGRDPSRHP